MERDQDLFEVLPSGDVMWKASVPGHDSAILKLRELSTQTANEVRVIHLASKTLIATINGPKA
jgi:hypothetical protein